MYLRRINVNLYQDIKVLTHYCSTIGKPISGLDRISLFKPGLVHLVEKFRRDLDT